MRSSYLQNGKALLAKILVAIMVMMMFLPVLPTSIAQAASSPVITKKTSNILVGDSYDLNVSNKIKGSTYAWTTSNKKVATVNKSGFVTGVSKGVATITCNVKAPKKTYKLTCKVTIIEPASRVKISNKIDTMSVGQTYDLNRLLIPSASNEKTTWSSSDTSIAAPDKNGKFTALKEGTVTITAKTTSGLKDKVTIEVTELSHKASTQKELEALLADGVASITIKTEEKVIFTIPAGNYSKTKLIVDAPKSDVTNNGLFASIEIKSIASDTWYEKATGNVIDINALIARIIVESGASTAINMRQEGSTLKIENNGKITELVMDSDSAVNITGSSTQAIPITANTAGIKITTNVPLTLTCNAKIDLVLLPGSEATTVQAAKSEDVPKISGTVTIKVTVGTGADAKVETVVGTPVVTTPAGPTGGGSSGGSSGGSTDPLITTETKDGKTYYYLAKSYKDLSSIKVTYNKLGLAYTINSEMLNKLEAYLAADAASVEAWKKTVDSGVKTYANGVTVRVTGTKDSATKDVALSYNGISKTYTVTVGLGSVTVEGYTISTSGEKTLIISPVPSTVTFEPQF